MAPQRSKYSTLPRLLLLILIIYLLAPMIAGLFPNVDRRGPRIFWNEHHELLCTLVHELVYDTKPRPFLTQRAWFYGLQGKPDPWIEANDAARLFEEEIDESALLALRQSFWSEGSDRLPSVIPRSQWPQSFTENGVIEVRIQEHGIYVVLKRERDHEAGIFLLGNESARRTIENDSTYSRGTFWKSGIYDYYHVGKQ